MEKLIEDFSFGLFFWQTLLFFTLMFLLRKFAWKPILEAVNSREEGIKSAMDQAKKAREEVSMLKSDNDKVLKQAREERDLLLKDARDTRDKIVNDAKNIAKTESDKILTQARNTIQVEKTVAINDLKNQVAQLSIGMAEKVLTKELTNKTEHESLVKNLIENIKFN